jgi:hypothetical protein
MRGPVAVFGEFQAAVIHFVMTLTYAGKAVKKQEKAKKSLDAPFKALLEHFETAADACGLERLPRRPRRLPRRPRRLPRRLQMILPRLRVVLPLLFRSSRTRRSDPARHVQSSCALSVGADEGLEAQPESSKRGGSELAHATIGTNRQ